MPRVLNKANKNFSELLELDSNNWQHVRGSALIISMKAIALAFDISSTRIPQLPPAWEYAGYTLCPANLVLGPFVTFSSYKNCHRNNGLSAKLLMQVVFNSLLSLVFIALSSCFLIYLISDNLTYLVTYRDALIFRCSHYFISFMSSATLLVSGIDSQLTSDLFGYQVTKPLDIELPRSLIPVVISWNIPIHLWIKTCKFISNFISLPNLCFSFRYFSQPEAVRKFQRDPPHLPNLVISARSQFPTRSRSIVDRRVHVCRVSLSQRLGGDIGCLRRC